MRRHTSRIMIILLILAAAATVSAACAQAPSPTARPAPPTSTKEPASPTGTPAPGATSAATRAPEPTATEPVFVEEEDDCWASCKKPVDVTPVVKAGKPQPADHAGREACLSCHKTLPGDHLGRLDATCLPCHDAPAAR